jgi:16S rRNA (uracil1498-N3)-methyltransferase
MRRFYSGVPIEAGELIDLSVEESRHLRDVLRLAVGENVTAFDGKGREFSCLIETVTKRGAALRAESEVSPAAPESPLHLTVGATVIPGDKYDLIVQKSVELGVRVLIPLVTIRCEVKLVDVQKRVERWRRIALEATKQCGRAKLIEIAEPQEFATASAADPRRSILFSERDGEPFSSLTAVGENLTVFYGPKGGWDDKELAAARESGITIVTLGGRILRAETAAIGITAVLQHRFGDMN